MQDEYEFIDTKVEWFHETEVGRTHAIFEHNPMVLMPFKQNDRTRFYGPFKSQIDAMRDAKQFHQFIMHEAKIAISDVASLTKQKKKEE